MTGTHVALNRLSFSHPRRVASFLLTLYVGLSLLGGVLVCWYDAYRLKQEASQQARFAVGLIQDHLRQRDQDVRFILSQTGPDGWQKPTFLPDALVTATMVNAAGDRVWSVGDNIPALDSLMSRKGWGKLYEKSAHSVVYAPLLDGSNLTQGGLMPVLIPVPGHTGRLVLLFSQAFMLQGMPDDSAWAGLEAGIESPDMYPVFRSVPLRSGDASQDSLMGEHLRQQPETGGGIQIQASEGPTALAYARQVQPSLLIWAKRSWAAEYSAFWQRAALMLVTLSCGQALLIMIVYILFHEMRHDRRKNRQLQELNRNLARSNADLEQFAYIASHDLKEPLRNIGSYVQLLQRRYEGRLDEDADTFINYTVDGVRRLQTIINELLAYSRIGTGQLQPQQVPMGVLVGNALGLLKGAIAEAQASVEVRGTLPLVEADAAQMTSLFQNLIANAIKYRAADIRAMVEIGYQDRGGEWAFYVRDNGIGIDPQYHQQIFGLFKRLHNRDHYSGSGIGLSVCQRIVERHGGHIWVESRLGEGTCFWFTLPKKAISIPDPLPQTSGRRP